MSILDYNDKQPNVILSLSGTTTSTIRKNSRNSSISTSSSLSSNSSCSTVQRWSCHKDILISSSNYFKSIFSNKFNEAEASIVFLPLGIFTPNVLDDILYYMYNKSIKPITKEAEGRNLEILDQLQSFYMAADYLGMEDLCLNIQENIIELTHGIICYCNNCTILIPQLLYFTGSNQQNDVRLSKITLSILKLLINDPEKTLPTFWCSSSLKELFEQSQEMESLHGYLKDRLLEHVNKNNAIETLHGCFLAKKDRVLDNDWLSLIYTQNRIQNIASKLLADHFDFYCTKYPKLLSCVDGVTYSFQFLEYLLSNVLDDQMNVTNACLLYKGIVKNLMCRDNVQRNPSVKLILKNAKQKTIRFIATHLNQIKEMDSIDKTIIEQLAQDLAVPVTTLLLQDELKKRSIHNNNNNTKYPIIHHHNTTHSPPWNIKFKSKLCSIVFGQPTLHFKIGQRVQLLNRPVTTIGTIAFVGKISLSPDKVNQYDQMLGVELDRTVGTTDGEIHGQRYFTTLPNKGIFVKPSEVTLA